jgi:ParB family transcriptional regulator, chromosome partitioning protein
MSKQSTKPRATFTAASFGNLRAAAGESHGEAIRILLGDIDEDPNQPRRTFDQGALESMAESIKEHGVVQPIVVRPPVEGRYMLAFGARRLRASKLAGVADIPAVIRAAGPADFAAQVIENQQRADLSNSELAAAIAKLAEEGKTNKQIGAICSLKDYQVAAFRQARNFPLELRNLIDNADMRALYDLYRQWQKTATEVIEALPGAETFITVTEARRIIGGITGKPTGSIILDRPAAPAPQTPAEAPQSVPAAASAQEPPAPAAVNHEPTPAGAGKGLHGASPPAPALAPAETRRTRNEQPSPAPQAPTVKSAPVFMVAAGDGQEGRLVVDRAGERAGSALVAYATGIEEVDAAELRIVRIE